ncbi:unnamed protein product, partial [Rotaria magnacalcarata]
MATSDNTVDIKLQNLKVEESTTPKPEATNAATTEKVTKPKKEKSKQEKPKQEKPKQEKEKPKQEKPQAADEAPAEVLDYNRSPEEIEKALEEWSKKPST